MLGTLAGALMRPLLADGARALLLGIALVAAGGGALLPQGRPALPRHPLSAALLLAGLALTDRAAFITFALAASSATPWLTGIGAAAGSIAASAVALSDPVVAARLPQVRQIAGTILLGAGIVVALGAVRLI